MNRLLLVLILLVAVVLGLGFYRRWFNVASDSADGKAHLTLTVDKDKIQQDEKTAVKKVQDLAPHVNDKAVTPTEKSKDEAAPPAQPPKNQE